MQLHGSCHFEAKELDITCGCTSDRCVVSDAQMVNRTVIVCARCFSEPATTASFDTAVCSRWKAHWPLPSFFNVSISHQAQVDCSSIEHDSSSEREHLKHQSANKLSHRLLHYNHWAALSYCVTSLHANFRFLTAGPTAEQNWCYHLMRLSMHIMQLCKDCFLKAAQGSQHVDYNKKEWA